MNIKVAKRAALCSAILIAVVGALRMRLAFQELQRSGSQDALIAVFTSALGIAAAYGIYRMNRIAAYAMLVFSMWLIVVAVMDEHIGTIGVVGVAVFAMIVACGAAAAWSRHRSPA